MENYVYEESGISQHIRKCGVDIRPPINIKRELLRLQTYSNWLIEQFPEAFETQYSGPEEFRINKRFQLPGNGGTAEMPTFSITNRGVVYSFPIRMFINNTFDIELPDKDQMFRKALEKLREILPVSQVVRVGVINEMVFDTGTLDSVEILFSTFKNNVWKGGLVSTTIRLQYAENEQNRIIVLTPVSVGLVQQPDVSVITEMPPAYGIHVKVDINNQDMTKDISSNQIAGVLAASEDYVPEKLIAFLNGGVL